MNQILSKALRTEIFLCEGFFISNVLGDYLPVIVELVWAGENGLLWFSEDT